MMIKKMKVCILALLMTFLFIGCTTAQDDNENTGTNQTTEGSSGTDESTADASASEESTSETVPAEVNSTEKSLVEDSTSTDTSINISSVEGSILDTSELFTERDLQQSADLTDAVAIDLEDNQDVTIDQEGIYILSGEATNSTVIVEADAEAKVQIVLDGVSITNENAPAIYVKSADKVFVTMTDSENYMEVSGTFTADGETNTDAVIFSKDDLILNGVGTLKIVSNEGNGISSKDDLKVTGGVYNITSSADGLEANNAILIYDGEFSIVSDKDAVHSENEEDTSLGYIYILNGTFNITAGDDAIQGNTIVQIDGGTIKVETCVEGIESTYIQINDGTIDIYAKDDGINATNKSSNEVVLEVNGGTINVSMGSGDTDAFDANGSIYINDGTINIEASSAFDSDGTAELNGGTVTVNGEVITEITRQQMGGGGGRFKR